MLCCNAAPAPSFSHRLPAFRCVLRCVDLYLMLDVDIDSKLLYTIKLNITTLFLGIYNFSVFLSKLR